MLVTLPHNNLALINFLVPIYVTFEPPRLQSSSPDQRTRILCIAVPLHLNLSPEISPYNKTIAIPMMADCSPRGVLLRSLRNHRDTLPKLSYPKISPEYPHPGRPSVSRGPVPRPRSNLTVGCSPRFLPQQFSAICGNDSSRFSMHLRSRYLPRPSASSPLDNKAPPMANTIQAPDLEGLHREIHGMAEQMRIMNENNARLVQLLAAAIPPPPAAPPIPDVERSHHSNRSGGRSQNLSTDRARKGRRRSPSPPQRERASSLESSESLAVGSEHTGRGRSPHRGNQIGARDKSTSQKIRDLDARLDAINTGTNAPSKADKYIAAEELAEAKRRRRGKEDHKRNEPNTRRIDYREEYVAARLSPNSLERRYGDNRPIMGDIQTIHGGFGSGGCSTSSKKRHARSAHRSAKEEVYNLSTCVGDYPPITFSNDDLRGLHLPHDDALVVSSVIANFNVQRILIDNRSSTDILFISAFERMKIGLNKLHPFHTPLIGFEGNITHLLGWINLPITLGAEPHQTTIWQDFIVVDCPSPYNAILGRPTLGGIKAITLTYHLKLKFPTSTRIGKLKGDQRMARQCFISTMKGDVPSINPKVAMHKLFANPEHPPVRQKRKKFAPKHLKLKKYLGSPPLLTVRTTGEDFYVYLSILPTAVSAVLIREEDQVQKPVYYVSKVLMGAETRYPRIEKLAYTLMTAARKLRHYFQAHPIIVLTDQPLKQILQRPDTSGRLLKWSIELSEFHIEYRLRVAIKGQALADFIIESTHESTPEPEVAPPEMETPKEQSSEKDLTRWELFVDGSSNHHGCGAGLVIQTPSGEQMEYAIRIGFKATNNEAEYEAFLAGLRVAAELGAQSLDVFSDSQLVVNQVQGDYLAKDARMMAYLGEVKAASAKIKDFKIRQIPWEENKKADALSNLASTFESISDRCIPLEFLASPSIEHLVCRFRIPKVIISDNARQFDNNVFKIFCSNLAISHHFSSLGHPQENGKVEVSNCTIRRNLKARLERSKSEWAEELPNILWAYHTTSRIPTSETPYSMVFGTESVIPVEIGMPSFRTSNFDKKSNEIELRLNLDLLDEKREMARLRQVAYKCQVTLSTKELSAGKLGPTWEDPYKVIKVSRPGTYWLEDPSGKVLPHPWNVEHLKKYYQ
ncbi:hypothetical protein Acr_18g0011760 [Actinidia rufa]|uniref:Uncharacterized protein n=1 Tax=Actinidia rufa TaxID=165716 RepID=A0A7J0G879_9ERIC|nr:hypothetical protein Acr_18g0011760 [Actinidia rufa]